MTVRGGLVVVAAVLLAVLLQGTWATSWTWRGEWPDLALVTAVLVALLHGNDAGLLAGLAAGLGMGWMVGLAGPAFCLSRVGTVAAMAQVREQVSRDNPLAQMIAVWLGSVLCEGLFLLSGQGVLADPRFVERVLIRSVLNACLGPFLALLVARVKMTSEVAAA